MTTTVISGLAGQLARHVTPEHVAAATYEITDMTKLPGDADRVLASGAATSPAWSLVLDDDAGADQADPTLVPVAATVGPEIDEPAILSAPDGLTEETKVSAISAGVYVRSASLLGGSFPATSTLESLEITAPIPAAVYDFEDARLDGRALRVEWRYTLASGRDRVATVPLEIVLATDAAFSTGPAIQTLLLGYPDIKGRLAEGLTVKALASYSYQVVVGELDRRCIEHDALMLGRVGKMLLVAKMLAEAALRGYAPGLTPLDDFRTDTREDYTRQLEALAIGTPGAQAQQVKPDGTVDENPDQTYRGPVWAA
jgi:hypothetical protein